MCRARRGGVWTVGGRLAGMALALLTNAVLARLLAPGDFGALLVILNVIFFLGIVARLGLDRVLIRLVAESIGLDDPNRARRALRLGGIVAAIATILTASAAIAVFSFSDGLLPSQPRLSAMAPWIGVGVALLAFLHLAAESLRGFHELRLASLFDARSNGPLLNLAFLTLLLAVAFVGTLSLSATLSLYVLSLGGVLAIAAWQLRRIVARVASSAALRAGGGASSQLTYSALLALCLPMAAVQVLTFAAANADLWVAGRLIDPDDLALFGAARRLTLLIAVPLFMANQTTLSFIPELHAQGRREELQILLQSTSKAATAAALALLIVVAVAAGPVLSMVFGRYYAHAATMLTILCFGQFVACWTGGCANCLAMTGHQNILLLVALATVLLVVVGGTLAAQSFGALGLTVVSAGAVAASNITQWLLARKLVGVWTHAAAFRTKGKHP